MKINYTTLLARFTRLKTRDVVRKRGWRPDRDWHIAIAVATIFLIAFWGIGVYLWFTIAVYTETELVLPAARPLDDAAFTRTIDAYRARRATFEELRNAHDLQSPATTATTSPKVGTVGGGATSTAVTF